jgi:hypothetical protein
MPWSDLRDFAILALGDTTQFPFLIGAGLTVGRNPCVDSGAAIAHDHHG